MLFFDRDLIPEIVLEAYKRGIFPMAETRDDERVYWFNPPKRGIIPLDSLHIPRSLAKFMKGKPFEVTFDQDFPAVIRGCAEVGREETWISHKIEEVYTELWRRGEAHSAECRSGGELVGGLYGIAIGGAFFAESMFSKVSGASKVALVSLVERLRQRGFTLLDTQYVNDHIRQFGAIEVRRDRYLKMLEEAVNAEGVTF